MYVTNTFKGWLFLHWLYLSVYCLQVLVIYMWIQCIWDFASVQMSLHYNLNHDQRSLNWIIAIIHKNGFLSILIYTFIFRNFCKTILVSQIVTFSLIAFDYKELNFHFLWMLLNGEVLQKHDIMIIKVEMAPNTGTS